MSTQLETHVLTIPTFLTSAQNRIVIRDIARMINFDSAEGDVVIATDGGLRGERWSTLPEWVKRLELLHEERRIELRLHAEAGTRPDDIIETSAMLKMMLSDLFSYRTLDFPRKIFCIGWSRTGTTSVTAALRALGIFSWHYAPWVIGLRNLWDDAVPDRFDFSEIADYTAVSDLPVCALFKELDEAFPGSLFILTTRDVDAETASMSKLVARHMSHLGHAGAVMRWAHGADRIDEAMLRDRFVRHERDVLDYFGDRKDLLVLDLGRGDPWQALGDFLGLQAPDIPFPHLNLL